MEGKLTTEKSSPEVRPYDYLYKLSLVGDWDTGKESFMTGPAGFAVREDFQSTDHIPHIGVANARTIVLDEMRIKLQVWDTSLIRASVQRYRYLRQAEQAHGFIIVYDVTRQETFDSVPSWLKRLKKYQATVMLVGNKCDLTEEKVVDYRTAKDFADEREIMLMEVSAKDGTNVELAFLTLVAKIREAELK